MKKLIRFVLIVLLLCNLSCLNKKDITLIICNPTDKGLLSPTLKADNVKYDSLSKMAEYDFGYGYPSCIIVKDNIVISKHTLTPDIIHWLVKLIHRSNIESSIQHDVSEDISKFQCKTYVSNRLPTSTQE